MLLPVTLLAAFVAVVGGRGRARTGILLGALVVVFLASWPPTVWLAVSTLERGYDPAMPPGQASPESIDAMVVLSGYMRRNDWGGPPTPGLDTYERLVYAAALHRRWERVPIIVTGGPVLGEEHPPVAGVMADYLVRAGVPPTLIEEEPRALNTHENALYVARLLEPRHAGRAYPPRVALVTEARHMRRAELAFAKQGLAVVPAPCCFASRIDEWSWRLLRPSWWSLQTTEGTLHEWLGLLAYRLRGWI